MNEILLSAITKADLQLNTIKETMDKINIDGAIENRIVASFVLISVNHFESIIELIKIDKFISASALVRPNFEAFIRGTWLTLKANNPKVKKVIRKLSENKDDFPQLWKMKNDVIEELDIIFIEKEIIEAFNSYTHGGSHLISRCMTEDTISPQFQTEEIIGMLRGVAFHTMMSIIALAHKQNDEELAAIMNTMIVDI